MICVYVLMGLAFAIVLGIKLLPRDKVTSAKARVMFSLAYPVAAKFEEELKHLRALKKLRGENESLIQRTIGKTIAQLHMPPALLWCLLFQESRLDHLSGMEEEAGTYGLGQFSYFSFYEINHQLNRFYKAGPRVLSVVLGADVRPIAAKKGDLYHPSSYYFIPTAVVSSALYLNNRYIHLRRSLEARGIPYDPELLWLYAAMAYNKGTRAVLAFWNEVQAEKGRQAVTKVVSQADFFFQTLHNPSLYRRSMARIWPSQSAGLFARELSIHMKHIKECSVSEDWGGGA